METDHDDREVAVDEPDPGKGRDVRPQHHRDAKEEDARADDDEHRSIGGQDPGCEGTAEDDRGSREDGTLLRPTPALGLAVDAPAGRAHRSPPAAAGDGSAATDRSAAASPARTGCQRSMRRPVSRFHAAWSDATLTSTKNAGSENHGRRPAGCPRSPSPIAPRP